MSSRSANALLPLRPSAERKDGQLIQISLKVSPIMDATGAIVGASSIARDITEHKQAEAKLHESEERLSLAVQAADLGTWDWDIVANRIVWSLALPCVIWPFAGYTNNLRTVSGCFASGRPGGHRLCRAYRT